MDYQLNETQILIQQTFKSFVDTKVKPQAEAIDINKEFPHELFKAVGELGFYGMRYPVEAGGSGLDILSYCLAVTELARGSLSLAAACSMQSLMATYFLYRFGDDEIKTNYFAPALKSEKIGTICMTEPNAGSDLNNITTTAKVKDDGFIINGQKIWITSATVADFMTVLSRTDNHEKLSIFFVPSHFEGVHIGKSIDKLGVRGSVTSEVSFDNVKIPKNYLFGKIGEGTNCLFEILAEIRIMTAALAYGVALAAYEDSLEYAKTRVQFGKPIGKFQLIQEKFAELTTKAQENYSGIRVIKSYVREDNEIKEFEGLSKDYLNRNMDMIKIQAFLQPSLFFITGLSFIIVIWAGGIKIIHGSLNLGDITAFLMYIGNLTWPMIAFGWVTNMVQQGEASMKRLNRIFAEPYEIQDTGATDYSIKDLKGEIIFKNVSFKYGERLPYIFNNINLEIPADSTLAIMGYTGDGKTSFVNLIPRLYDCTDGEITIDGKNVKCIPLNVLRSNIGLVSQESFLFSDTISNNISYGLREVDMEKVYLASETAHFDKDVETFPDGYETIMGERGITLSGGQKQRACLARALAIDPKILILDDSFSAVDTNTEEEILKSLKEFMKGRTSIIISHRISTVKDADKIIVISKGKIAEQGTHDQLVSLGGIYADLHYKQLLEKELEELN